MTYRAGNLTGDQFFFVDLPGATEHDVSRLCEYNSFFKIERTNIHKAHSNKNALKFLTSVKKRKIEELNDDLQNEKNKRAKLEQELVYFKAQLVKANKKIHDQDGKIKLILSYMKAQINNNKLFFNNFNTYNSINSN